MSSESESEKHIWEAGSNTESEDVEGNYEIEGDKSESEEELGFGEKELESEDEEFGSEDEKLELEDEDEGSDQKNNKDFDCEDSNDENADQEKPEPSNKDKKDQPENKVKNLLDIYEERELKSFFLRFLGDLTMDLVTVNKMLRDVCTGIIRVLPSKPKHTKTYLVDFDSRTRRNEAMNKLQVELKYKIQIQTPKEWYDSYAKYLNRIIDKRPAILKLANGKKEMGTQDKYSGRREKTFTSTIIVSNIPSETKIEKIKNIFPSAVNIKLHAPRKLGETTAAAVRLPSTWAARNVVLNRKYTIEGNNLQLNFGAHTEGGNHSQSYGVYGEKSSVRDSKIGKHKLKQSSTNDLPSPKKKKIHLKNENDKELMEQNENVKTAQSRKDLNGATQNRNVQTNLNWPSLETSLPVGWPKPFNKVNKTEQSFLKTNKLGQTFKANKAGKLNKSR